MMSKLYTFRQSWATVFHDYAALSSIGKPYKIGFLKAGRFLMSRKYSILHYSLFIIALFTISACASRSVKPDNAVLTEKERVLREMEAIYSLIESGNLGAAEPRLAAMVESDPQNSDYPVLHASLLLSMGELDHARQVVKTQLESNSDNLEALFVLSEIERLRDDTKARKQALDAMLAINPQDPDALAALGDISYTNKEYRAAERSYLAALEAEPEHVDALLGMGRILYRNIDMKNALDFVERALAVAPHDPRIYLDRSRIYYQVGRFEECLEDLGTTIELAPESAWAYIERGKLLMDIGLRKEALLDLSHAIELDDSYFLPYIYRAALYEETQEDRKALDDYFTVIKLYPEYWYAFESAGVLSYRLGLWEDAYRYFDKAASYSSGSTEYLVLAGLSLFRSGDKKAAKDYAGKNLSRIDRSKFEEHWLALRMVYDQLDNTAELELKASASKTPDKKSALLFYLASYWLGKGRVELAHTYLKLGTGLEGALNIETRMAESELARLEDR